MTFQLSKLLIVITILINLLTACSTEQNPTPTTSPLPDLHIVSGSENEALEPMIQAWAAEQNVSVEITYLGSLDIMLDLQDGQTEYDAVWASNSLWITLGDRQNIVKHTQGITRSPVVLGLKRSIAEALGWIDSEVSVNDILEAAEASKFYLMMTSATQSNSGASAYLAFLYAFAGNPTVLTSETLNNPEVKDQIKRLLGTVDRAAGSSGWLKDLCIQQYSLCDAMINYESLIIEANQTLVQRSDEPLYVIYPSDGLAIADSPLGYVDHGDTNKETLFLNLQQFLLSDATQQQLLSLGRRAGLVGLDATQVDTTIFNPEWGIDVTRVIQPITFPTAAVIEEALFLYQTAFRKPSFTIYALDYSGSMFGEGETQLKAAMQTLLDQGTASQYLLQASPDDITVVILFNGGVINPDAMEGWMVQGNNAVELRQLNLKIQNQQVGGDTNIYAPVQLALDIFETVGIGDRFPAVILMTDGQSNQGSFDDLQRDYQAAASDIPIFAITFGEASIDQLTEVTNMSSGRIFDGAQDLISAFRSAKGYN